MTNAPASTNYVAWIGAILGVTNFVLGFLARRPVVSWEPRARLGDDLVCLKIYNQSKKTLLVKSVRGYPLRRSLPRLDFTPYKDLERAETEKFFL